MRTDNYIIAHCAISNNTVCKNGQRLFGATGKSPHDFLMAVYQHLQLTYPKFYKMDGLSKLGWLASEILLAGQGGLREIKQQDVAIVLANSNASLDTDIKYLHSVQDIASPALFVYTLPNIVTGEICIRNGFKGENAFFVGEDFNAALTEQYVGYMLNGNIAQLCICGWVEYLNDEYKAVLFLVGKTPNETNTLLTKENLQYIFNQT